MNKAYLVFILCISCNLVGEQKLGYKPELSFYYWKNHFKLSPFESQKLKELEVKTLYIKFFDVSLHSQTNQIQPIATLHADTSQFQNLIIIPCVYIENRVFYGRQLASIDTFALKLSNKILAMSNKNVKEIHIDCDWTKKTKEQYFYFLKQLKTLTGKHISATIRLHQVKYSNSTGIPPIEKGVLMCYNMGIIQSFKEKNSIFDISTLDNYTLHIAQYPLSLAIALPIYSWNVIFRNEKFIYIHNNEIPFEQAIYLQKETENIYRCIQSTHLGKKPLLKGDIVRFEMASTSDLKKAILLLNKRLNAPNIIFYHLNSENLQTYETLFNYSIGN